MEEKAEELLPVRRKKQVIGRMHTKGAVGVSSYQQMPVEALLDLIATQQVSGAGQSRSAADQLIKFHMPFILRMVERYRNKGLTNDELIQLGRIGFFLAIRKNEATEAAIFTSYAFSWIWGGIAREFKTNRRHQSRFVLMDQEGSVESLIETYPDMARAFLAERLSTKAVYLFRQAASQLDQKMKLLSKNQEFILRRYTGFMDELGPDSLESIGKELGFSRANAHHHKNRALSKIGMTEDQVIAIATAYELLEAQG